MLKSIKDLFRSKEIKHHAGIATGTPIHPSYFTDHNILQEIAARRKTDTLLNTVLTLDIGFTTGSGYFLESESDNAKMFIENWIMDTNFDDVIEQMSNDLLAAGNTFLKFNQNEIMDITVLPLDGVSISQYDSMGKPMTYNVTYIGQNVEIPAGDLLHFTWRKQVDGMGMGIASVAASKGYGYYSNSGMRVKKQNYFESREGILDLTLKAFAASLPRYLATTTNANEESIKVLSEALAKIEPLSSLAVSDDVSVSEMSLNSRSKIDAMIQVLQQEDVSALASPIQQMWSLRGHSWAAARESVRVMMPFLHSFELSVAKSINRIFAMVLEHEGMTDPVSINFSTTQRLSFEDIKTIMDIVNSNPAISSMANPEKIFDLLKMAGVDLTNGS